MMSHPERTKRFLENFDVLRKGHRINNQKWDFFEKFNKMNKHLFRNIEEKVCIAFFIITVLNCFAKLIGKQRQWCVLFIKVEGQPWDF